MKRILVSIKRVPDIDAPIVFNASETGIETEGIPCVSNPFDEIALEAAVQIKEQMGDVEVVAVSVGALACEDQLRAASAVGADRAVHILTDAYVDSEVVATLIAEFCVKELPCLILMGKQATDSDSRQTAGRLARRLGIGFASCAESIYIDNDFTHATVACEVDDGVDVVDVKLPAVVSCDLRLNEPRYPSLAGIINSRRVVVEVIKAEELVDHFSTCLQVSSVRLVSRCKQGVTVTSPEELLSCLVNKGVVRRKAEVE